jgi:uncharacterized repeat protein (TIGR04076 family)
LREFIILPHFSLVIECFEKLHDCRKINTGGFTVEEEKLGIKFMATVTGAKGACHANHKTGQRFELNCYDSGGLCGFFYHDIFPYLSVMQFGGKYPWWDKEQIEVECPDRYNTVSLRIEKKK